MARYFVALYPPEPIVTYVLKLQDQLQQRLGSSGISWVMREKMHSTLRFLGTVPEESVESLITQLQRCALCDRFELVLEPLSFFSQQGAPQVLFVQTSYPHALQELITCIHEATAPFVADLGKIQKVDAYVSHVTLARFRKHISGEHIAEVLAVCPVVSYCWSVTDFVLVRSDSESGGWKHTEVARICLR